MAQYVQAERQYWAELTGRQVQELHEELGSSWSLPWLLPLLLLVLVLLLPVMLLSLLLLLFFLVVFLVVACWLLFAVAVAVAVAVAAVFPYSPDSETIRVLTLRVGRGARPEIRGQPTLGPAAVLDAAVLHSGCGCSR